MRIPVWTASLVLLLIVAHVAYEYWITPARSRLLPRFAMQSARKKWMVSILLPMSAFTIPPLFFGFYSLKIQEQEAWATYFLSTFLFAFAIGPTLLNLYFGNVKLAGIGFSIRMSLTLILVKWG